MNAGDIERVIRVASVCSGAGERSDDLHRSINDPGQPCVMMIGRAPARFDFPWIE